MKILCWKFILLASHLYRVFIVKQDCKLSGAMRDINSQKRVTDRRTERQTNHGNIGHRQTHSQVARRHKDGVISTRKQNECQKQKLIGMK